MDNNKTTGTVKSVITKTTSTGKTYWLVSLQTNLGEVKGSSWDDPAQYLNQSVEVGVQLKNVNGKNYTNFFFPNHVKKAQTQPAQAPGQSASMFSNRLTAIEARLSNIEKIINPPANDKPDTGNPFGAAPTPGDEEIPF